MVGEEELENPNEWGTWQTHSGKERRADISREGPVGKAPTGCQRAHWESVFSADGELGRALTSSPSLLPPPRVFFRRHYPLTTLRFCGMDPEQRK